MATDMLKMDCGYVVMVTSIPGVTGGIYWKPQPLNPSPPAMKRHVIYSREM